MTGAGPPAWHRWIEPAPKAGWLNMACDAALLERAQHAGECWLRLYTWSPACLSFGRHEPAANTLDHARLTATGLDVVRRPTGGGAVLHHDELTYSVAAPIAEVGGPRAAYGRIHAMLADALRLLGIESIPAPRPARVPAPGDGPCFAGTAGGELLVGGRKAVGSAQLRRGATLLQHGSILLSGGQDDLVSVFGDAFAPPVVASLGAALGRPVPAWETAGAVAAAAEAAWPGGWREPDEALLDSLTVEARRHGPRFRSSEWTWCR